MGKGDVCCFLFCPNRRENTTGASFFQFPKDEKSKATWIEKVQRPGWRFTASSRLCSDHFTDDCFVTSGTAIRLRTELGLFGPDQPKKRPRRLLRHDAVPTVFVDTADVSVPQPSNSTSRTHESAAVCDHESTTLADTDLSTRSVLASLLPRAIQKQTGCRTATQDKSCQTAIPTSEKDTQTAIPKMSHAYIDDLLEAVYARISAFPTFSLARAALQEDTLPSRTSSYGEKPELSSVVKSQYSRF